MKKVTAGRDMLGDFAPKFAEFNDDVLFGEVWSREEQLSPRIRSMITVSTLMASGILDSSLKGHIARAKENGVCKEEIVEVITHVAFYAGWPKAWAAFAMAMEIYEGDETMNKEKMIQDLGVEVFETGDKNDAFAQYFTGQSYLHMLNTEGVSVANVTFEAKCRNNWHIHHKGGQILLVTGGKGIYQEAGQSARMLKMGDVVYIAPEVKHWHGAQQDSCFAHVAIEIPAEGGSNEWLEPVEDEAYFACHN